MCVCVCVCVCGGGSGGRSCRSYRTITKYLLLLGGRQDPVGLESRWAWQWNGGEEKEIFCTPIIRLYFVN